MFRDCTNCLMSGSLRHCCHCEITDNYELTGYRGMTDKLPAGCAADLPAAVHDLIEEMYEAARDPARLAQLANMRRLLGD